MNVNWATPIFVPAEAFPNRADQVLCVPGGTKGIYEVAEVWKDFKFIRDPSSKEPYALLSDDGKTLTFYYDADMGMQTGTTYSLNVGDNNPGWYTDNSNTQVDKVVFDESFVDARPTSTHYWFYGMENLESLVGIENLNTSEVTDMASMFQSCFKLQHLDLSHFNTDNLVNMHRMFQACVMLESIDLSSFNTANVTGENMDWLFALCTNLSSVDVSSFNTSRVTSLWSMFFQCGNLTQLDLTSFDTHQVTRTTTMFQGCTKLVTVYAGEGWDMSNVTTDPAMFAGCSSLVGGLGTTYDPNHMDATYAHIDGGPSNPGYFTAKNDGLRGDVNDDGQVKINDVTALIDYLLSSDATGINVTAADCNQDGNVKINDVTALIDYLLGGSW